MRVRVLELSDDSTKTIASLKISHNTESEKREGLVQEQHRFCIQVVQGQYVKADYRFILSFSPCHASHRGNISPLVQKITLHMEES